MTLPITYHNADEQALREQLCLIGRLMHQNGYIDGSSGNISVRLGPDRILATPSGLSKAYMTPGQMIILGLDGQRLGPDTPENKDLQPTSETTMHLECYRQRDDVQGVVHAHPRTAVAMTIAGYDFRRCIIPEAVVVLGLIPTTPYATPASPEDRDVISKFIQQHDAIMLAHHGSLTVASSVWEAYLRLESLEHCAQILYMAEQLGGARVIPPEEVAKLLRLRQQLGLLRPGDIEAFEEVCGVRFTTLQETVQIAQDV